ncbi:MAG TPA: alpha-amylase family glycosyl hydrolase [Kiritimatiellia bacterium]
MKAFRAFLAVAVLAFASRPVCAAPPHTFEGGVTVFEAEDFSAAIDRSGHAWIFTNVTAAFSSNGYMEATPNTGANFNVTWTTTSPELQHDVIFRDTGTHYVWVRMYASAGADDSIHAGIDGATGAASHIVLTAYGTWVWTNGTSGGGIASIDAASTGSHTVSLWMREDGAQIDRVAIVTTNDFKPRKGNAWHIPDNAQPAGYTMRTPTTAIYSNTPVLIFNGNQYQGGGEQGNQLQTGCTLYYKNALSNGWIALPMYFHATSGNDLHYSNAIPANTFAAGDVVQYYLKIPYSDHLPTYLYASNGSSFATELETVAQANPFSYTVLEPAAGQGYPSPDDWRNENIYFIFLDRFNDGDASNNNSDPQSGYNPTNSRGVHGGDFRGVSNKLDYIKSLGATAIWITPIPKNVGGSTYHGYGAHDFTQVAPHWGSLTELSNMVAGAHARGIRVVLDIVANHAGNRISASGGGWPTYNTNGYNIRWTVATNQYPAPFDSTNYFHKFGHIQSYTDPQQVLGELNGLDDLKTETTHVRTNMAKIYSDWIDKADFDGFRIDTVKHVDIGFWQYFNPALRAHAAARGKTNFFQFGEVFDGSDGKCGYYTGTQAGGAYANDSVVDYPLFFKVNSVFATAAGNTKQIEDRYSGLPGNYATDAQVRLVTFLDNHDQPRFLSSNNANNNTGRLAVALGFLYSSRGIPCLYYGTEQAFNGGGDPNNREDMFAGRFEQGPSIGDNFNQTHPMFQQVQRLNNFRRLYPSLLRGSHNNLWNNPSGPGLFAYARRLGGEEVYVVFNTASSSQTITNRPTSYAPGTKLVNLFNTNESVTVTGSSEIPPVSVPGTSIKMFISAALWQPLNPVVTLQSPAHAASNVVVTTPLVLTFNQAMDTNSVQAALAFTPAKAGSYGWTATNTVMTFTPSFPGWAGSTTYTVRVETGAMGSASGKYLYAPYETFFRTAASAFTDSAPPSVTFTSPAAGSTVTGLVTIAGTATDNVSVAKVEVQLDSRDWVTAGGTSSWSLALNSGHFLNGQHQLFARATDALGNVSTNASLSVTFLNVPGAYEQRIAAGSPSDLTNCDASVWIADRAYGLGSFGFSGGVSGYVANAISGVCAGAQALYQRERYSTPAASFHYVFDCPPGVYETTLLETETWVTSVDERVFNVFIEDQQVLTNFDILATAGAMNVPLEMTFTNVCADGQLDVHFFPVVDNARVSGVRVRKTGEADSDGDGIPDWWMLAHFNHATGQDADNSLATEDADADAMDTLDEYISDTQPTNAASLFRVEAVSTSNGPALMFHGAGGRAYIVQAGTDVVQAAWSDFVTNLAGAGGPITVSDTNGLGRRYFRISVSLQ